MLVKTHTMFQPPMATLRAETSQRSGACKYKFYVIMFLEGFPNNNSLEQCQKRQKNEEKFIVWQQLKKDSYKINVIFSILTIYNKK